MARILAKKPKGVPAPTQPRRKWARITKPMRPIRSIRTLIKVRESAGVSQPEFKNTLQRAGVGVRVKSKTISRQRPNTPPQYGTRPGKTIPPPDPTSGGGIRKR
jgi:hypothetical protein